MHYLGDIFWYRLRREYLTLLNERQKWFTVERSLKINHIVLISNLSLPCNQWPLGRVVETFTDKKGLVRSVNVKVGECQNSNLKDFGTTLLRT